MKDSSGLSGLGAGFPDGSVSKESACNAGDLGLISGWGRSPTEGNSYPLQYPGLENSMDWGCKEWEMTERLSLSFSKTLEGSQLAHPWSCLYSRFLASSLLDYRGKGSLKSISDLKWN